MLKYRVIAAYISNLTDARYFAARGVDHLLYDLDQISVAQIIEIQEWVSGPTALLLFVPFFELTSGGIEFDGMNYVDFVSHNGSESQGVILMGGDEERLGIKSYDDLDEILDQLEID